ncbi:MAG: DNA gyrase inhibitor YacG [Bauldia sp.]|nr:DNA gyrase inhibitor YacG [Bauldia sp.]
MSASAKPPRKARPCPICGKPPVAEWKPFCSARCKDVDLHHWLSGSYGIAAVEADEPDDGEGEAPPPAKH